MVCVYSVERGSGTIRVGVVSDVVVRHATGRVPALTVFDRDEIRDTREALLGPHVLAQAGACVDRCPLKIVTRDGTPLTGHRGPRPRRRLSDLK